ncbi:MAG TPA: pyridoxal 5'-phosphate synthase glutaminase subunit PdxT [Polyangiaceae bacterium]|nr:pyridoxal 5'-phosphate synthase glutaminase subunit PdxT [Polyangiaceae bacterium]
MKVIGVLALQGGFAAHARRLEELGHVAFEVRTARDVEKAEGLVLPGGESSAQLLLIERFGLEAPLRTWVESGGPMLATCAGLILAASQVTSPAQRSFAFIDIDVARNAYGRQRESFEAKADGDQELALIFIRAPRILRVGPGVLVLATLGGEPILVRQNHVTGATFHPELTDDAQVHRAVFGGSERESALQPRGRAAHIS